ncbi:hypothetical protein INT48_008906 [Thamnidium elegans]|uniref:Uncharacterized protein n=1 Tax=Thamnidium elegans TaxID=101142 RepID=A0A8H7SL55_9FUNG|nr:hypothetical protein INT48_008906 [Thamnidium elegans]
MSNNNWESQLSVLEKNTYLDLFKKVDADNKGIVLHDEAMEFLKKSDVPQNILNQFWSAADNENKGFLTEQEFCTILKLIACAQHSVMTGDPILATKVSLPEFNGTGAVNRQATNTEVITPEDRQKYIGLFNSFGPENNILSGDRARAAFVQSNLPPQTLQIIWNLADTRKSGSLNQTEFIIAMFYIERAMKGFNTFPPTLPASIYSSATGRPTGSPLVRNTTLHVNSPPPIPIRSPVFKGRALAPVIISPDEYQKYKVFFNQLDTDRTGFVSGSDAVVFFKHSKLPESDLAKIWDLADTNSSGMLSEQEFAIAMHMINKRVSGGDIPNTLPNYNIQPQQQQPLPPQQQQQQQQQPFPQQQQQQQQQQQNVDLLGLSFDGPPPPPPPSSSNVDQSALLQSETNRVQNTRQQLQTESQAVQGLSHQIESQKEALAKVKAEAEEAERLLQAEKKKKEELTQQLQMYRQETKHFSTRADHAKEELQKVKRETEDLEKEKEKAASSTTSPSINHQDVFSLSSGPSLGSSGGLFAKVNEVATHHTGPSPSTAVTKDGGLFAKVNHSPITSHQTGPAKTFDPFAGFKVSSSTPSPTLSMNKLKQESEKKTIATKEDRSMTPTSLDISDIESKFPDLSTMEQNFAPAESSPSPAAATNIGSPKKTETPAESTKYGFDLSAFESFGNHSTSTKDELGSLFTSPTQTKETNNDEFDNIFGSNNNNNTNTTTNNDNTTKTTNFEDIFFK